MIFDYFIACCFYQLCFGVSFILALTMYKNTEEDSLWRDIFTLGEKKNIGGPPISFTIVYPIILFILLIPIVCNFYANNEIVTDIFNSRTGFIEHIKENWGKIFILWFISASIGWVIIETLFKEKIKK